MTALMLLGLLIALAGGIWFLVIAFQEHLLWGLGCLLLPFVSLVFLLMHFGKTWRPFMLQVLGLIIMVPASLSMAGEVRNQMMVPVPTAAPISDEQAAELLPRLKSQGIKFSYTLGRIYVKRQDLEQAQTIIAAPPEAK